MVKGAVTTNGAVASRPDTPRRWWQGWRARTVAGAVAVVIVAAVVLRSSPVPPYRIVSVDGASGGCYRVYEAPVEIGQLLAQQRHQEPFVVVYRPAAQPVFSALDLPVDREVVEVLPDGSVFGSGFALPAHAGPAFYRQPVNPVGAVVVYYASNEPHGGLPARSFRVGGGCTAPALPQAALIDTAR